MVTVRTPRAAPEVCSQRASLEWVRDCVFANKVVNHIVGSRVWAWTRKAEHFDSAVVTSCRKVLVCWIKGDTLDMTLMQ